MEVFYRGKITITDNVLLRQYIAINGAQCTAISLNCIPIDQRGRKYLGFHIMFIFYWCFSVGPVGWLVVALNSGPYDGFLFYVII